MNFEFEVVKAPGYETFNPTKIKPLFDAQKLTIIKQL